MSQKLVVLTISLLKSEGFNIGSPQIGVGDVVMKSVPDHAHEIAALDNGAVVEMIVTDVIAYELSEGHYDNLIASAFAIVEGTQVVKSVVFAVLEEHFEHICGQA